MPARAGPVEATLRNGRADRIGHNLCLTQVERRTDAGDWQAIGPSIACTLILRALEAGASEPYRVTLGEAFPLAEGARLVEGRYRLVTDVEIGGESQALVAGPFTVSAPSE